MRAQLEVFGSKKLKYAARAHDSSARLIQSRPLRRFLAGIALYERFPLIRSVQGSRGRLAMPLPMI